MKTNTADLRHDVVVIGGGVSGTALLHTLASYTNVGRVALIERRERAGAVNSHPLNNSQTSHDGGTETNYDLTHALVVKKASTALRRYVVAAGKPGLYRKTHRMVLAVGDAEVRQIRERYARFKEHYPDLRLVERDELALLEPEVVLERDPQEPIVALYTDEGFAVNYQALSESFIEDARARRPDFSVRFGVAVNSIVRSNDEFVVTTSDGVLYARAVVVAAGPYSLLFAQSLGYAKHLGILPVAGSFFSAGDKLRGKVYTVQIEGMPFAAVHGDPDLLNAADTRFGPTTKPLPLMERHVYRTFRDFIKLPIATFRGLYCLIRILFTNKIVGYVAKNMLYDLPIIGSALYLREARKIVPSLRYKDITLRRGVGGIRPQIVDLNRAELLMGDATIVEDGIIFNTTPSPGASVCLANARRDVAKVSTMLGISFNDDDFERTLG